MPDLYVSKPQMGSHALSAFCYMPLKAHFETQGVQEQVVLLLRRHPITNLSWILLSLVMLSAPLFFSWLPIYTDLPARFQLATVALWIFLTLAIILQGGLTWFFNVNIITDKRVLDVDFTTLIYREISDVQIAKIQEVTYKVAGFGGTFFNYGDVQIQTAGAIPNFVFEDVPQPARVAQILQELEGKEGGV